LIQEIEQVLAVVDEHNLVPEAGLFQGVLD
jgi:hypothetical protein